MRRTAAVLLAAVTLAAVGTVGAVPAYADDPTPTTTAAAPTAPVAPVDLSLSTAFGNGAVLATARGTDRNLALAVTGSAPDSVVTLVLPTSLTVVSASTGNGATAVTCTPATGAVSCALGAVQFRTVLQVVVAVDAATPIGTVEHVDATVTPVPGPDANPIDNSAAVDFTVAGRTDLTLSADRRQVDIPVGGTGPVTVTLHNDGPDPATNAEIGFAVESNDTPRPTIADTSVPVTRTGDSRGSVFWEAGTVPVGGSVSITVTVAASGPVTDSILTYGGGADGSIDVCDVTGSCEPNVPIRTVAAAAPTPAPSTTSSRPTLAATGSDDGPLAALGLGLLLVGAATTVAGRRRTR